jgi:3-oxoacyl-[acyl-carrier protein] reductase
LKKALVTGASGGIGKAIAMMLATRGYDVVFHYRHSKQSAELACDEARSFGVRAIALSADLCDPISVDKLLAQANKHLGGLSVLVNNVGNWVSAKTTELSVAQWREALDSNLNSTFYVSQAALPYLRTNAAARIVNIAAAGAQHVIARDTNTAYIIAKTGVIIYSKSLAKELVSEGITVNVIAPGIAENSFEYDAAGQDLPFLPAKRPARLSEVADAAWFFIKADAQYVTGQVLEVSGGWAL